MQSTREVPLTRGYVAIVDADDYERVMAAGSWCANDSSTSHVVYAQKGVRGDDHVQRTVSMHTFLTGWAMVDHRNGNGLDNRRANLREATVSSNAMNRRRRSDNSSGFKGVSLRKSNGKWRASVSVGGSRKWLGEFPSALEAARAYDAAALEHYGEFARLNFPNQNSDEQE